MFQIWRGVLTMGTDFCGQLRKLDRRYGHNTIEKPERIPASYFQKFPAACKPTLDGKTVAYGAAARRMTPKEASDYSVAEDRDFIKAARAAWKQHGPRIMKERRRGDKEPAGFERWGEP
jgi:hypothetical protein